MKIQLYIRYYTRPGESLLVTGSFGGADREQVFPLRYLDQQFWHGVIEADPAETVKIRYRYIFVNKKGEHIREGGAERIVDISKTGLEEIRLIDSWNYAGEYENVFYSAAFRNVLLEKPESKYKVRQPKTFTHIFRVKAPLLKKHEVVCLLGETPALGAWDTAQPLIMKPEKEWWTAKAQLPADTLPTFYKYGVYNVRDKHFLMYESGDNRILYEDTTHPKKLTIVHDGFVRLPNDTWKGAAVSVPVFSLRSDSSFGVGEFRDLKLLADWAAKTGLKMIQVLPVNDTTATYTWKDSYPYAAISAFALHPLYLHLPAVAGKPGNNLIRSLRKKQKQLNELAEVDYEQVMRFKLSAARELFHQQKEEMLADPDFNTFFRENRHWLIPYAAFCYLRDKNGSADFSQWRLYGTYNKSAIEKYVSPKARHYNEIAFVYFLQYHLHLQLKDAVDYARRQGVVIKGDMPIGVGAHSCETWTEPELFHLDRQSGAPPDDFATKGQNWLFPTYNWERLAEDGFAWWRRRFVQLSKYFDALRIDHILGFFRIWSIPEESVQGVMGFFDPAIPVHVFEFGQKGMWFNYHRFCKPHITDEVLWELFGPAKEKLLPYLIPAGNQHYQLAPEFSTQRKVEQYFETLEPSEDHLNIRNGLYELIANVILFEVPGSNGQQFHFRIGMATTSSFRYLDENIRSLLQHLYVDYFYRRQEELWRKEALNKLPFLKEATDMLVCGEDLGMVPAVVPEVMKELGILGLNIQRMPKESRKKFFHPAEALYLSVVSPSTHDMSTIRTWWEEDRETTQQFFNGILGQWGEAPDTCEAWINKAIVMQHLYSPAMWSVFQIQDILGMDDALRREDHRAERINVPAETNHFWKYRMHISLEQLLRQKDFNEEFNVYIEASGR